MDKAKIFRAIKAKSPTILSCLAAAGLVSTVILTVRATVKAVRYVDYKKEPVTVYYDNEPVSFAPPEPTKKDIFKAVWKDFIPAAATGVGTIICIFGANIISKHQKTLLASAHAMIYSQFLGYSNAVKERFGNEAHEQILQDIVIENPRDVDIYARNSLSDGVMGFEDDREEHLFYDMMSKRYFKSTFSKVLLAEYHLNRNFCLGGTVDENQFYEFLGLDPEDIGCNVGWDMCSGICWIDFEHIKNTTDDGSLEYYIISPIFWPEPFPVED